MQLQLGEIEGYIKSKEYDGFIATKVGMILLDKDKLTLSHTDIALENLFINTGINKDTTLNEAIDIGIVTEHLLRKKEVVGLTGKPVDNTQVNQVNLSEVNLNSEVGKPVDNTQVNQVNLSEVNLNSEVGKPVDNTQVNQVNLPNNCFIGFKVNQAVFNKIKYRSEHSGIPISAIMRDVVEHNF